jgi:CRISPR-associated protein Csb1
VNLVALRGLHGTDDSQTAQIRKYLLALSLVAATADIDLFLREGCHLRYAGGDEWYKVPRRGDPTTIKLAVSAQDYAKTAVEQFRAAWLRRWPENKCLLYSFNLAEARKLLGKKNEEEAASGEDA